MEVGGFFNRNGFGADVGRDDLVGGGWWSVRREKNERKDGQ
jgi:hypothetical protein